MGGVGGVDRKHFCSTAEICIKTFCFCIDSKVINASVACYQDCPLTSSLIEHPVLFPSLTHTGGSPEMDRASTGKYASASISALLFGGINTSSADSTLRTLSHSQLQIREE